MSQPLQVVMLLDLANDNPIVEGDVIAHVPHERERREVFRATESGARGGPLGKPDDWGACSDALTRMTEKAQAERGRDGGPSEVYVAGRAALPAYVMVGYLLSTWSKVTVINQRKDGIWDVASALGATPSQAPFFEHRGGIGLAAPSEATGLVAVSVACGHAPRPEELRAFVKEQGASIAGIVELHTTKVLDGSFAPSVGDELNGAMVQLARDYPHRSGIALFVAGPVMLALLAGRAINPNVHPGPVLVPDRVSGSYRFAIELPWRIRRASKPLSCEPVDELARREVLDRVCEGVRALQGSLQVDDLPPWLAEDERKTICTRLATLELPKKPEGEAFFLDVARRKLMMGPGLLDALRLASPDDQVRIGQSITLHELVHVDQEVLSTTYRGIGRAGVALEEVDYWADAAAIGALASWEIRRGGDKAREGAALEVGKQIDAALRGSAAFDHAEQGDRLHQLPERRLRRYLIWALQRARADSVRAAEDVWRLFGTRLTVELAPLAGSLDDRYDKLVRAPLPDTELFVVLGSRLARTPRDPNLDPGALVERVRALDTDGLVGKMRFVRDKHRRLLDLHP